MSQVYQNKPGISGRWHFALGGVQTNGDVLPLAAAIGIHRLRSFPTQHELTAKLDSPFVAGIIGHYGQERITHQLIVEANSLGDFEYICDPVRAILAGLRVRTQTELFCPAVCNHPWDDLVATAESPAIACRFEPHVYSLDIGEPTLIDNNDIDWVKNNLGKVLSLSKQTRFSTALDALCSYLHTERDRMKAAQLWVGIEAIFEVQFEISYRVPLLAALMLKPRGPGCKQLRDQVKKLYNERSKAIHGQEFKNAKEHVHEVRKLLARLLTKIIEDGHLPNKDDFDDLALFDRYSERKTKSS
jgi:ribosomal protein L29